MTKMLSASGGLSPLPHDQGLCPDHRYKLVLSTRHGAPNHSPLPPPLILAPRAPPTYFDKFTPMDVSCLSNNYGVLGSNSHLRRRWRHAGMHCCSK